MISLNVLSLKKKSKLRRNRTDCWEESIINWELKSTKITRLAREKKKRSLFGEMRLLLFRNDMQFGEQ